MRRIGIQFVASEEQHCCEEPGRVLVWIVIAATVTKVVEGCLYLRRRYYAIFGMLSGGEFEHSVLRSPLSALSSNTTTINKLIRPRGGQGIRAWTLRTEPCSKVLSTAGKPRHMLLRQSRSYQPRACFLFRLSRRVNPFLRWSALKSFSSTDSFQPGNI